MHWSSLSDFLAMGGYALYVWPSYVACALLFVVEPWLARRRRLKAIEMLKRMPIMPDIAPAAASMTIERAATSHPAP